MSHVGSETTHVIENQSVTHWTKIRLAVAQSLPVRLLFIGIAVCIVTALAVAFSQDNLASTWWRIALGAAGMINFAFGATLLEADGHRKQAGLQVAGIALFAALTLLWVAN